MKTSEILESAAFVAMVPGAWCQGKMARDENCVPRNIASLNACKFCAMGLINANNYSTYWEIMLAENALSNFLFFKDVVTWNDHRARTAEEVAETLWLVAQKCKENGD